MGKISDTNIYFTSGEILKCHKFEFAYINPLNTIMTKFKFSLLFLYVSYRDSNSHVSTKSILCNHVPIIFP